MIFPEESANLIFRLEHTCTLKMWSAGSSEGFIIAHQTAELHVPEEVFIVVTAVRSNTT
jgi:hypothetical protein